MIRNRLFLSGTQSTEGAKVAVKADLRLEVPSGDAARHGQYSFSRSLQLKLGAAGEDRNVAFEIVKHQGPDRISPLLICSHGVDRKLQALVCVFLGSSLTGLVVDNVYAAVGGAIDPIDSAGNLRAGDLHVEPFFRVQNFRWRN